MWEYIAHIVSTLRSERLVDTLADRRTKVDVKILGDTMAKKASAQVDTLADKLPEVEVKTLCGTFADGEAEGWSEQEDIKRLDDILVEMKAEEVVATLADRLTEVETLGDTLAEVMCKALVVPLA